MTKWQTNKSFENQLTKYMKSTNKNLFFKYNRNSNTVRKSVR